MIKKKKTYRYSILFDLERAFDVNFEIYIHKT